MEFSKKARKPASKIADELGIGTYTLRAVQKSQVVVREAMKQRKKQVKEQRSKEAAEFAERLALPDDHPGAIRQSQPIWYEKD